MVSKTFKWIVYQRIIDSAVIHATLKTAFPDFNRRCLFVNISIASNARIILLEAGKSQGILLTDEDAVQFLEVFIKNTTFGTNERMGYIQLLKVWKRQM